MKKNLIKILFSVALISALSFNYVYAEANKSEIKQKIREIKALHVKAPDYTQEYLDLNFDLFYMYDFSKDYKNVKKVLNSSISAVETMYGSGSQEAADWYIRAFQLYSSQAMPVEAKNYLDKASLIVQNNPDNLELKDYYERNLLDYYITFEHFNDALKLLGKMQNKTQEQKNNIAEKKKDIYNLLEYNSDNTRSVSKKIRLLEKQNKHTRELFELYGQEACYMLGQSKFNELYSLYKKADALRQELELPKVDEFNLLWLLENYYLNISDYKNAKNIIDKRYAIAKELKSKELMQGVYRDYRILYSEIQNIKLGKKYLKKEYRISKKYTKQRGLHKLDYVFGTAEYYMALNKNNKAIDVYNYALNYISPYKDLVPSKEFVFRRNIGELLRNEKRFDEAFYNLTQAEKYMNIAYPVTSPLRASLYDQFYAYYDVNNDSANALKYSQKSKKVMHNPTNENNLYLHQQYLESANKYAEKGKKKEALAAMDKDINIIKNIYGVDNVEYYRAVLNKIGLYEQFGMKNEADELYFKELNNGKKINGDLTNYYYELNFYRSTVYRDLGRYEEALSYACIAEKYALNKDKKNNLYSYISDIYSDLGNVKKAKAYSKKVK